MDSYRSLPKTPGVYLFKNNAGKVIYVGKAKSLRDRVGSYFQNRDKLLPRTAQLVSEIVKIDHVNVESEIDALLLEANLIRKFSPKYNVAWKDGKAYPLIEITAGERIPQVHFVHKEENPRALYFGPYPTGSDLSGLLRFLRRIFPYVSANHPGGKACLRSHLGLCPCPEIFVDQRARRRYLKDLKDMREFLLGNRQMIQKKLAKEMNKAAKKQDFERAGEIKRKLEQIAWVTEKRRLPWEYEVNPNLVEDRRRSELRQLEKMLNVPGIKKIESYDISNISGRLATGAQVTFVDGVSEKSLYRRYRIHFKNTPDDFAMMGEMISRRLQSEVPLPQLIVIDGGKGQLSFVVQIITQTTGKSENQISGISVSHTNREPSEPSPKIIALAKRLETIYTDDGQEIQLPLNNPALQLLQRMRDEAHRFSRKYHFLLRQKNLLT